MPFFKNYCYLTHNKKAYLTKEGNLRKRLLNNDGFLVSSPNIQWLENIIKKNGLKYKFVIEGYPSVQKTTDVAKTHNRLFYCGTNWDEIRFNKTFLLLSHSNFLDIYGPRNRWPDEIISYRGEIPFDGKSKHEFIKKAGITLCLHSRSHKEGGVLSARVFEGLAAGSVVISGEIPGLRTLLKDHVLYVDQSLPPEKLALAIQNHINWILKNPIAAHELAKKGKKLFLEKFTLEQTLEKLNAEHKKMMGHYTKH